MGFGEMNLPVPTWGDYMNDVGTYGEDRLPGRAYTFVIKYEAMPKQKIIEEPCLSIKHGSYLIC